MGMAKATTTAAAAAAAAAGVPSILPTGLPSLVPSSAPTGGYPAERSALEAMYASAGGKGWLTKTHWMDGTKHVSEWYGVTGGEESDDDGTPGAVTRLQLPENNLTHALPSELGLLSNMENFDLRINSVVSSLPTELALLRKSTLFAVRSNSLSLSIPTELALLSNVESLHLDGNFFTSSIPSELALLSNVADFELYRNFLTSSIPTELAGLSKVENFYLYDNSLTSSIPTELAHLRNVEDFYLYENSLASSIPTELARLSKVEVFDLSGNSLTSSIPSELARLRNVESFHLYENLFNSSIPSELARLSNVEAFYLYDNSLTSSIPSELAFLSKVEVFDLFGNSLTSSIPTELGHLNNVAKLLLQSNNFMASIPSEIGHLRSLGIFDASNNSLSEAIPSEIGAIGSSLNTLILSDNKLQSTLPSSMCNLTNLEIVSLSSNRLHGGLPVCPNGFLGLQVLDVGNNTLEGHLPSVKRWPKIRHLLLHENGFTGSLKELEFNRSQHDSGDDDDDYTRTHYEIDYGANLVTLTLHNNSLMGNIPPDLALPRSLETLTFAGNKLTGRLPRELLDQKRAGNRSTMTIYGTNNRLSCDLPSWNFTSTGQSLVLIGNKISWEPPAWVNPIEVDSEFLSTVVGVTMDHHDITTLRLPPWLFLLIQAFVVALISAPPLVWYRRNFAPPGRVALTADDNDMGRFSPVSRALLSSSYGVVGLGAAGLMFLVLFGLGGNFYECGDALMKYTTAAYVSDDPVIEWLLACGAITWAVAVCFVMRRFLRLLNNQGQHEQQQQQAMTTAPAPITAVGSADENLWQSGFALRRNTRIAFWFTGWLMALVIFGGAPTMLYVATYSLPNDNRLGLSGSLINVVSSALALYLSLVSGDFIPLVTKPTVRAVLAIRAPGRSEAQHHEWESVLGIIARTLVVVVLPVISVLLIHNSCGAMWTRLWDPCYDNTFVKTAFLDYFLYNTGTEADPIPVFGTIDLRVLHTSAVCDTHYQEGKCARGVLEILYPLFTSKLIYAILIAALKPFTATKGAFLATAAFSGDGDSSVTAFKESAEPDPMHALIWYETAFIFGCLSPLMVLLAAAQLYAGAITFEWRVRRAPSTTMPRWWGAEPLPILRRVLKAHLVLVMFLQSAMIVFFFVDTKLRGWQMVAAVVPAIFVINVMVDARGRWQSRRKPSRQKSVQMPRNNSEVSFSSYRSSEAVDEEVDGVRDVRNHAAIRETTGRTAASPMHHMGGKYMEETWGVESGDGDGGEEGL